MPAERTCKECGAELPANAPEGLCPRCLAGMGLGLFRNVALPKLEEPLERPGTMIGRYKLLEKIGEGGFGIVYMAEQQEPVQRKVALKIIKPGMDTREVIARFEAERQAIALMDHPNIARVLDAGATDAGRPYFVMELVRGIPITDYCDQNKLPTRERLLLFMKVCQAVQHAHQKAVIHRDLKPSNVLVTLHDGEPVPKVIDFGVAKALGQRLTEKTLFTGFQHMLGTPAYMSPEQAALGGLDIDTRADIYSLGVLLYELLTGVTPFDNDTFRKGALDEIRRMIRETEPPKPSTRLQTLGEKLTDVARQRHTEPAALSRLVRGDLDWIVMRCLEKDRQRRYETANALAKDLERHLNVEPIVARPPSALYQFQKLVRRHRLAFAATSAVAISLVIGLGLSTWLFVKEKEARGVATREKLAAESARAQTTEKLYDSYLAQAQANRLSGRPGRFFDTMETIAKAVAIRPSLELRDEAIACLALDDLRLAPIGETNLPAQGGIVFDPTLELFALVMANGDVTVRRVRDNLETARISVHELGIRWLHGFSQDGRYLAFHTDRASHCIWDLQRHEMALRDLPARSAMVFNSEEDECIGAVNPDGTQSFYSLKSRTEIRRPSKASAESSRMAFHADTSRLAGFNGRTLCIEIVDVKSGALTATLACPTACEALAWSRDGKWLAAAGANGRAYIWDAAAGKLLQACVGHDDLMTRVAFNQAGTLLATTGWDDTTRLWDVSSGAPVLSIPGSSYQLQFSPDDQRLGFVVQGTNFGLIELVNHPEYRRLAPASRVGRGGTLAASPDNRFIAAMVEGQVRFWDSISGREIGSLPDSGCASVFFDNDGKSLITCGNAGLARWPIQSGVEPHAEKIRIGPRRALHPDGNAALVFGSKSADGGRIAVVLNYAGEARVIDVANPDKVVVLSGHPGMRHVSISPDAKWAATGTWNGSGVKVWDAQTGKVVHEFSEPSHADVLFSPDGKWLVTAGAEYRLWATESWQPGPGVTSPLKNLFVGVMAFSPDSQVLAIAYGRRAVRLLETKTGRVLADFEAPSLSQVKGIAFNGDGTRLLVSDGLGQVHVWNLRLIRARLAALKLDWNMPPCAGDDIPRQLKPVTVEVISSRE